MGAEEVSGRRGEGAKREGGEEVGGGGAKR